MGATAVLPVAVLAAIPPRRPQFSSLHRGAHSAATRFAWAAPVWRIMGLAVRRLALGRFAHSLDLGIHPGGVRHSRRMNAEDAFKKASGLRPPDDPRPDADALDVAIHYLGHWEKEFLRARLVVKKRATAVVIAVSTATASVAVVSAATAITGWAWMGIVTAVLAGIASVVSAWDGLFRHRELWLQRSLIVGRLQEIHRLAAFELALEPIARNRVATEVIAALSEVLAADQLAWSELRSKSLSGQRSVESA